MYPERREGGRRTQTRRRSRRGENMIANANVDANARDAYLRVEPQAQGPQPRTRQYPAAASPNDEELPGYSPPPLYNSPPAYPIKNPLKKLKKYIKKKMSARREKKATRAATRAATKQMRPAPPEYTELGSSGGRKRSRKTKRIRRKHTSKK